MDPSVRDQLLERDARRLPPDRIESGENNGLRSVVDDYVDAGGLLEGPDVPAFAADDPALHLIGWEGDHRNRRLGGVIGGDALDREGNDLLGLAVGVAS